jgi:hypothetical protein
MHCSCSDLIVPRNIYDQVIDHCAERMELGIQTSTVPKAFGLLTSSDSGNSRLKIAHAYIETDNDVRGEGDTKKRIDDIYKRVGVIQDYRDKGWEINPVRLFSILAETKKRSQEIISSFHIHPPLLPPDRIHTIQKPTQVDLILNHPANFPITVIIDYTRIQQPIWRAFSIQRDQTGEYQFPDNFINKIPIEVI